MEMISPIDQDVALYMKHALLMLTVAARNLEDGFYSSSINRSYYAIFYAANALLASKGISRSKHSGVISAFRLHFIKSGIIETEYSRIFGRVMDDRHQSDYDVFETTKVSEAKVDLDDAVRFVNRIQTYFQKT